MPVSLPSLQLGAILSPAGRMPVADDSPPNQMPSKNAVGTAPYWRGEPLDLPVLPPRPRPIQLGVPYGQKIPLIVDEVPPFFSTLAGAGLGATAAVGLGGG